MNQVKKEQRQVNKKFCESKRGIVEKAQETRSGTSHKHSKYNIVMVSQKSCFMSYVIVKSPSKPYIAVHSHTALRLLQTDSTNAMKNFVSVKYIIAIIATL